MTVASKAANPSAVPRRPASRQLHRGTRWVRPRRALGLAATAEAVDDQETAAGEVVLQQYGFRSAYQRTWVVKGTAETLIIRVQVMGSPKQALGYFNLLTFDGRLSSQVTKFPTPQLADSSGFARYFAATNGSDVSQDINLARGRLFYHLIFPGPQGSVSPSDVLKIAGSQGWKATSLGYT